MSMRGRLLKTIGLAASAATSAMSPASAADDVKPNIVFILSDDQGWTDVAWRDKRIPTPNLDRLRREGVELMAHYGAPVCSPTRAALLTGRYWSRFGIVVPDSSQCLPDGTPTVASELRGTGYRTALTGKWHLGGAHLTDKRPNRFGFDHTYGSLDGAAHPYTHEYTGGGMGMHGKKTWHRQGELIEEEGHVTDLIAREAVGFIRQTTNQPFFLYVPFTAPHALCVEPAEWLAKVPDVDPKRQAYAAMVTHMDDAIGRIVTALEKAGVRGRTMIVFASDNGGSLPNGGCNAPLRSGKGTLYEGGIRTVALANWPGRLRPGVVEAPVCVTDWMPTFCKLAGHTPPKDLKWDGRDIWPLLAGQAPPDPERVIYCLGVKGEAAAVRQGDWKLLFWGTGLTDDGNLNPARTELYNLRDDLSESRNLATEKPDRVAALLSEAARAMTHDRDAVCRIIGGDVP